MKLFLAGDSTVADCPPHEAPMAGWGQVIGPLLPAGVTAGNKAKGGRSSNSFIEEGLLEDIWQEIKTGDLLLIQFGHNDQKDYGTKPWTTYLEHLAQYIDGAVQRGAKPVLVTPVQRRTFNDSGKIDSSLGAYPAAMKQLAAERAVPLIDLHEQTKALYESYGPEPSKALFTWLAPGEHPNYPAGIQDNTHFSETGAKAVALLVVEALQALGLLKGPVKEGMQHGR